MKAGDSLLAEPLSAIWKPMIQPGTPTIVSFTNPVFLWTRTPHSRIYFHYDGPISAPWGTQLTLPQSDPYLDLEMLKQHGPLMFSDSWTGTGEVMAVNKLARLFSSAGSSLVVKRSRSVDFADVRDANVIFLGSPWANELQQKLRIRETPFSYSEHQGIVNHDPRPGEPDHLIEVTDPRTKAITATYALFSVLPGLQPGKTVVISAGLSTQGTWAAIDYFTSHDGATELLRRFRETGHATLPKFFQAVIRVDIVKGEPGSSNVVLTRVVDARPSAANASSAAP